MIPEDAVEIIQDCRGWEGWPLLPVRRGDEVGVMVDVPGMLWNVYRTAAGQVVRILDLGAHYGYGSAAEVVADGWMPD